MSSISQRLALGLCAASIAISSCGDETGGSTAPSQYKGKKFMDLSSAEQKQLCVAVKADLAPLKKRFFDVSCTELGVTQTSTVEGCESKRDQCLDLSEDATAKDPKCEKELLPCQPQTRVDEYLACVEAIKKLYVEAEAKLTSCNPEIDYSLEAPEECLTFSVNVYCEDAGHLLAADEDYW